MARSLPCIYWHICLTPQATFSRLNTPDQRRSVELQIKNIKLHIVTDIKVTINSLSVFGFRYLVGGRVTTILKKTMSKFHQNCGSMYYIHVCHIRGCIHTIHACICIHYIYVCTLVCLYVKWVFMWTKSNVNVSYVLEWNRNPHL